MFTLFTGLYLYLLVYTCIYWFILVFTGLYLYLLVCTCIYWFVLVFTGLYLYLLVYTCSEQQKKDEKTKNAIPLAPLERLKQQRMRRKLAPKVKESKDTVYQGLLFSTTVGTTVK